MKTVISVLFLFIIAVSCNQTNWGTSEPDLSLAGGDHIDVELWVSVPRDMDLLLFYAADKDSKFTHESSLTKRVRTSDTLQKVQFSLPAGVLHPQLRVDFLNVPEASIKRVTFRYGERSIDAVDAGVFRYFRPDLTKCTVNVKTGELTAINNKGSVQSPSLYPHAVFMHHQMEKLTQ